MNNIETVILNQILKTGSVKSGDVLIVHCSFKPLSKIGFKPTNTVDALIGYLGDEGTLLMPSMTWRTVTPENPVFDEANTEGHVGILSEEFRKNFPTCRSLHPTHSVVGLGKYAEFILSTHHYGCTPLPSVSSPYAKMTAFSSKILLLNVDLNRATAFHQPEEYIRPDVYLKKWHELQEYTLIDENKTHHNFKLLRHSELERDFEKYRQALIKNKGMTEGNTEGVNWCVLNHNDVMSLVTKSLLENPHASLAKKI